MLGFTPLADTPVTPYPFVFAAGAYTLAGLPLGLIRVKALPMAAGALTIAGKPVDLRASRILPLAAGGYLIAGQPVELVKTTLRLDPGEFTITGIAVDLRRTYTIFELGSGSFVVDGQEVAFAEGDFYFRPDGAIIVPRENRDATVVFEDRNLEAIAEDRRILIGEQLATPVSFS